MSQEFPPLEIGIAGQTVLQISFLLVSLSSQQNAFFVLTKIFRGMDHRICHILLTCKQLGLFMNPKTLSFTFIIKTKELRQISLPPSLPFCPLLQLDTHSQVIGAISNGTSQLQSLSNPVCDICTIDNRSSDNSSACLAPSFSGRIFFQIR